MNEPTTPKKYRTRNVYLTPAADAILDAHDMTRTRIGSQFVNLLILASPLNPDAKDRELSQRELDVFIERLLND